MRARSHSALPSTGNARHARGVSGQGQRGATSASAIAIRQINKTKPTVATKIEMLNFCIESVPPSEHSPAHFHIAVGPTAGVSKVTHANFSKIGGTPRACAGFNGAAGALVRKVTGSAVRRSLLRAARFLQVLPRVRSTSPSRDVSRHHVNGWNHSGLVASSSWYCWKHCPPYWARNGVHPLRR
jgi:hypothetical protein